MASTATPTDQIGPGATVILRVNTRSPVPPYEQIRTQVSTMVQTAVLADGARLPTIRQLAKDLGLASGTVARAYRELEAEGTVITRGRHGTVVTSGTRSAPVADRRHQVEQAATTFAVAVAHQGADLDQALDAVRRAFTGLIHQQRPA